MGRICFKQIYKLLIFAAKKLFFWRTHHGAELDLLLMYQGKKLGFEFKFSDAPKITKSMNQALTDLKLDHLFVIYPGKREIPVASTISIVGLEQWNSQHQN